MFRTELSDLLRLRFAVVLDLQITPEELGQSLEVTVVVESVHRVFLLLHKGG